MTTDDASLHMLDKAYNTLGAKLGMTPHEINNAYYNKVKSLHECNMNSGFVQKALVRVNEAYATLYPDLVKASKETEPLTKKGAGATLAVAITDLEQSAGKGKMAIITAAVAAVAVAGRKLLSKRHGQPAAPAVGASWIESVHPSTPSSPVHRS